MTKQGRLIVFSAPSGSGKTTIVRHLLKQEALNLAFSISATSREKRGQEINGEDYYFLTAQEFKNQIKANAFLEWEEVYRDNFYGTLKSEIDRIWSEGKHVIFDVDVKGGISLKKYFGENALSIFVKVPDLETLKARLTDRNTESEESLSRRLYKAEFEMSFENQFDSTLVNDELPKALKKAEALVKLFLTH